MININGRVFAGNSATNINGRGIVISGDEIAKFQQFDERKSEDAKGIEKITIDSRMVNDVNISASSSSQIEVHFYGEAIVDRDIDFDVCRINDELRITVKLTGHYCYDNDLKLDITVPQKTFKAIIVESFSADITLEEGVATDYLQMKTQSGDVETNATFTEASISTLSGDVEFYIDAKENISIEVSSMSGGCVSRI